MMNRQYASVDHRIAVPMAALIRGLNSVRL